MINAIKYLIKGGSHSKQAWVDILSLLYAISLKHHEMRNMTMQCWVTLTSFGLGVTDGDTWGVTHGDT